MITLQDIRAAAAAIRGGVLRTPFVESPKLSAALGAQVFLKFENLQYTGSFKERGALNRLLALSPQERARGVIAASAGNHAQGVAYHARRLGIQATIVMPAFTPMVKVEATRALGADIVLDGETLDHARATMQRMADEADRVVIHPYDDDLVIAGQGTIGLELLEDRPDLDALVISVGGGGLIAGIAVAAKAVSPGIAVVGVQAERFPAMVNALHSTSHPVGGATIAEGIAVPSPGARGLEVVQRHVDALLTVDEGDLEQAIVMLLEVEKTVAEGAAAAGLAALLRHPDRFAGQRVGLVLCGGNIDPLVLADIVGRGMARAGRLARVRVEVRDAPGALAKVAATVAARGASIEDVHHHRTFSTLPVQAVTIEFVLRTRGHAHVDEIVSALAAEGIDAHRVWPDAGHAA